MKVLYYNFLFYLFICGIYFCRIICIRNTLFLSWHNNERMSSDIINTRCLTRPAIIGNQITYLITKVLLSICDLYPWTWCTVQCFIRSILCCFDLLLFVVTDFINWYDNESKIMRAIIPSHHFLLYHCWTQKVKPFLFLKLFE